MSPDLNFGKDYFLMMQTLKHMRHFCLKKSFKTQSNHHSTGNKMLLCLATYKANYEKKLRGKMSIRTKPLLYTLQA